jgi:hypothetical protein
MTKEYKGPRRPAGLEAVLQELETQLAVYEAELYYRGDLAREMYRAGYREGLRRAINIIRYEIGIRQDPPNINYPGERPQ